MNLELTLVELLCMGCILEVCELCQSPKLCSVVFHCLTSCTVLCTVACRFLISETMAHDCWEGGDFGTHQIPRIVVSCAPPPSFVSKFKTWVHQLLVLGDTVLNDQEKKKHLLRKLWTDEDPS